MTLEVNNLTFAFDRAPALRNICVRLDRARGRIVALIGPNASGKSTLLRCIIGALRPDSGAVLLNGRALHRMKPREIAHSVAYVPQRSIVSAAFSVRQVVELGRYALSPSDRRVIDAIDRMDLSSVTSRPYRALSVGQQQRVMLARALAQLEPHAILALDEPTAAMDLRHVAMTHHALVELAGSKMDTTIIIAMHDLTLAASIAQEVWLLKDGRLIASGSAGDVLEPEHLRAAFDVGFYWQPDAAGRRRLLADLPGPARME